MICRSQIVDSSHLGDVRSDIHLNATPVPKDTSQLADFVVGEI